MQDSRSPKRGSRGQGRERERLKAGGKETESRREDREEKESEKGMEGGGEME